MEPWETTIDDLHLRPFRVEDAPAVRDACRDAETQRWLTTLPRPYELHHAQYYTAMNSVDGWSTGPRSVAVTDAASGRLLASIGLVNRWESDARAEIGYWVTPAARGRGVASRATLAVAAWSFATLGVRRLELLTDTANVASQRVAEKAGFTREGLLREFMAARPDESSPVDQQLRRDAYTYSLLPADLDRRSTLAAHHGN